MNIENYCVEISLHYFYYCVMYCINELYTGGNTGEGMQWRLMFQFQ